MAKKIHVTINEAAEVFGVTRATILKWRRNGLSADVVHGRGFGKPKFLIKVAVLKAWSERAGKPIRYAAPLGGR